MKKKFYRVCHIDTKQGIWYDQNGGFTGLIHDQFSFCVNSNLKMDHDADIVGFLSATPSLDDLFTWFPVKDIARLEDFGYYIHEYESDAYFFYDKHQHFVINQQLSTVSRLINVSELIGEYAL